MHGIALSSAGTEPTGTCTSYRSTPRICEASNKASTPPCMVDCTHRREAQSDAESEPMLSSFLYASVLAHDSFARALAFVLANRLANTTLLSTQLFEVFLEVLSSDEDVRTGALADIIACRERVRHAEALLAAGALLARRCGRQRRRPHGCMHASMSGVGGVGKACVDGYSWLSILTS